MSEHLTPEAVKKHVQIYVRVFLALAALTVVTVAISTLHMPILWGIAVALTIATFKSSLVAAFFMHLVSEKKIILWLLLIAVPLALFLLIIPTLSHF